MSQAQKPDERYLKNALQQAGSTEEVACRDGVGTALGLEAHIAAKTIRAQHARIAELEAAPAAQAVEPPQHQGMTIAGNGSSELGQLMRKQWEARGGLYPDGNPNAGQP